MGAECTKCNFCKQEATTEIVAEVEIRVPTTRIEDHLEHENKFISETEIPVRKEAEVTYIMPFPPNKYYKTLNPSEASELNIGLLLSLGGKTKINLSKSMKGVSYSPDEVIELHDKSLYKGEFNILNLPHGRGIIFRPDGSKYIGYFKKGKIKGQGRLLSPDNIISEGNFVTQDGGETTLSGESSVLHGLGTQIYPKGIKYKGEFNIGTKHGQGVLKLPDCTYTGNFENDEMSGYGVMIWKNGKKYEGEWKEGLMHGKGTFKWPNGKVYVGQYEFGEKSGIGTMKWPNNRKYEGEWKFGKQHGIGKYTFFDVKKGKFRARNSMWEDGERKTWLSSPRKSCSPDSQDD